MMEQQLDHSSMRSPGMYCHRGISYAGYDDNVTYGYPDNGPSSEQLLTMHPKHSNSMMPAPSIFPENIYSSSGFDMMDILVNMTTPPPDRLRKC